VHGEADADQRALQDRLALGERVLEARLAVLARSDVGDHPERGRASVPLARHHADADPTGLAIGPPDADLVAVLDGLAAHAGLEPRHCGGEILGMEYLRNVQADELVRRPPAHGDYAGVTEDEARVLHDG